VKDTFNLVIQMADPRVQPYLNEPRFIQSQVFTDAIFYAIDHYKAHHDRGHMVRLWQVYASPVARRRLNHHFFAEAGVRCSLVEGKVHFDSDPKPTVGTATKTAVVQQDRAVSGGTKPADSRVIGVRSHTASLQRPLGSKLAAPAAPKSKKKKRPKKVDLLDSWARLPGSYGSGGRR
jgi:hypothetical protein